MRQSKVYELAFKLVWDGQDNEPSIDDLLVMVRDGLPDEVWEQDDDRGEARIQWVSQN